jgi:prepilin-type N-terminal cleavage/methylation domain-containing protein
MRQRRQSGFTIIELMVSLTVAAVLVAMAAPSFRDVIDKSKLRGATDDLLEELVPVIRAGVYDTRGPLPFDDPMSFYEDSPMREWRWLRAIWAGRSRVEPDDWWRLYFVVLLDVRAAIGAYSVFRRLITRCDDKWRIPRSTTRVPLPSIPSSHADLSNLPAGSLVTPTSPSQKYSTQVTVSPSARSTLARSAGNSFQVIHHVEIALTT